MSTPKTITAETVRDAFSVADRVVLITGASQNLGATMARVFASAGAKVAAAASQLSPDLKAVVNGINEEGGTAIAVGMNLEHPPFTKHLADIESQLGPVDILINNAVVRYNPPLEEITVENWDRVYNINLRAPFLLCQALLPGMVERRFGRVINITGTGATDYMPPSIVPSTSKAALLHLTRALASRYASHGPDPAESRWPTMDVTVNAIQPAGIAVTSPRRHLESAPWPGWPDSPAPTEELRRQHEVRRGRVPAGRPGQMEEYALSAIFLASPAAGYITGATLYVSGGHVI